MGFSIRGIIAGQKQKMRERQSLGRTQNLEKITELREERVRLEQKQAQEKILKEEKAKIREIKTEKARSLASRVGSGLKKVRSGMKQQQSKSRLRSEMGSTGGSRDVFGGSSRDVFGGGRNVFSGSSNDRPKEKPKRVIINIR